MNTLFRNKILTGLVILLLIANITTILMFWMGMRKHHPRPHQQAQEYIIKELAFNDAQQKQYKEMVNEHRRQSGSLNEEIRNYKDSFFNMLALDNMNDSSKNNKASRIASLNQQLDILTFEHFKKVRTICNPDQQRKFDKIIKDVLRMMAGPAPPDKRTQGPPPDDRMPPPPGH
jgi:protein CpxP